MAEQQKCDLIILGASGFTGKYVVREALKFYNNTSSSSPLKTIALAGRNPTKLTQTLKWASHPNPPPQIPILTVDTSDPQSISALCVQTKLILNCIGPFRVHGEQVVSACVQSGCDYLDICGEPGFMETIEANHGEKAVTTGSLVVTGCGFDSVPAELGFMFNSRQWVGSMAVHRINAYLSLESNERIVINYGSYESFVLGEDKLIEFRRPIPQGTRGAIIGPTPPKGSILEHQPEIGLWAIEFPSADSAIVRRTLSSLAENPSGLPGNSESPEQIKKRETFWSSVKPAHFGVKMADKSLLSLFLLITMGISVGILRKFAFGRCLLLKFPLFFSFGWFKKGGPTEEQIENASFKMWFVGHGYSDASLASEKKAKPDMEIITRVMGPEVGYVTTPIILIQCALILLSHRQNLPKGGVLTPGIVFGPTDLQERLQENGISFDIVSKSTLPA